MDILLEFLEFIEATPRPDLRDLMDRVLLRSRNLTGAEAGSIYIVRREGRRRILEPASFQNVAAAVAPGALGVKVDAGSIAGYVARTGKTLLIPNAHRIPASRRYRFNPASDHASGFYSKSVLCFPLTNHAREVIGVVQLINRRDRAGRGPLPFTHAHAGLFRPINHIVGAAIERTDMLEQIAEKNRRLAERSRLLARQRRDIAALKDQTEDAFQLSIRLLARAAELHDEDTGNHIVRVNEYSYFVAGKLGMPKAFCDEIRYAAQLHDVGKMSVDSAVLKKKGPLTPEDRREMNLHPEYGYRILAHSSRLEMAAEIAWCHHEKWDGSGYPRGLKAEAIPISARIVQLADVYDALRAERPYKSGFSHEEAFKIICKGDQRIDPRAHFDPRLIEVFSRHHAGMDRIWRHFQD